MSSPAREDWRRRLLVSVLGPPNWWCTVHGVELRSRPCRMASGTTNFTRVACRTSECLLKYNGLRVSRGDVDVRECEGVEVGQRDDRWQL